MMNRLIKFGVSLLAVVIAVGHLAGHTKLAGNHNQTVLRGFGASLLAVVIAVGHLAGHTRLAGNHNQTVVRG